MKHLVKPACKHGCRFLLITPGLWLCPHASYGETSYLEGAVDEARRLLERAGGYDEVLAGIVRKEDAARQAKQDKREQRRKEPRASEAVRYG